MLTEKEVEEVFEFLGLQTEKKRKKILSTRVSRLEHEKRVRNHIILDNVTSVTKEGNVKSAKLE